MDGADTPAFPHTAHGVLRERTRAAHDAAEATDLMHRLMGDGIGADEYTALLAAQWRLFRDWENEHRGWLDGAVAAAGWHYVSRAGLLEADLAHAGGPSPPYETAAQTGARGELLHGDDTSLWGMLYVVEGSALGGRVIARRLRERFPDRPHTFYAVGESTPAWRHFQAILDTVLDGEAAQAAAVQGAQRMFARFQSTLKDPASHA